MMGVALNTGFGYYWVMYDLLLFAFLVLITIVIELAFFLVVYPILKEKPRYVFLAVLGSNAITGLLGLAIVVWGSGL